MCLGMPGRVVAVIDADRRVVRVAMANGERNVSSALLAAEEQPHPGDHVLVHAGLVVSIVDEEEARAIAEMLEGFGTALEAPARP